MSCVAIPPVVVTSWKACLSVNSDGLALTSVGKTTVICYEDKEIKPRK